MWCMFHFFGFQLDTFDSSWNLSPEVRDKDCELLEAMVLAQDLTLSSSFSFFETSPKNSPNSDLFTSVSRCNNLTLPVEFQQALVQNLQEIRQNISWFRLMRLRTDSSFDHNRRFWCELQWLWLWTNQRTEMRFEILAVWNRDVFEAQEFPNCWMLKHMISRCWMMLAQTITNKRHSKLAGETCSGWMSNFAYLKDCGGFMAALSLGLPLGPFSPSTRDSRACRLLDECRAAQNTWHLDTVCLQNLYHNSDPKTIGFWTFPAFSSRRCFVLTAYPELLPSNLLFPGSKAWLCRFLGSWVSWSCAKSSWALPRLALFVKSWVIFVMTINEHQEPSLQSGKLSQLENNQQ